MQIRNVFAAGQGGEKKPPSCHSLPQGTVPPLCDADETKPRILDVVLDSQSNKYGDKWVRVWRRAIKMIEEPRGMIYDEGIELNAEKLAS